MYGILSFEKAETIFYKIEDVLDWHLILRVALHDKIQNWDNHEKLGDVFCEVK